MIKISAEDLRTSSISKQGMEEVLTQAQVGIDLELWAASRALRFLEESNEFNNLSEGLDEDTRFALARLRSALAEAIPYRSRRDWAALPTQPIDLDSLLLQKFEELDADCVEDAKAHLHQTLGDPVGVYYSTDFAPVVFLEVFLRHLSERQKLEAQIHLAWMTDSDLKEYDFFELVDLISRDL